MMKDLLTVSEVASASSSSSSANKNKKHSVKNAAYNLGKGYIAALTVDYLNPFASFVFQIYRYVLIIPILCSSATNLNLDNSSSETFLAFLGYLNIIFSICISIIISWHDFGISFRTNADENSSYSNEDHLSRRLSI